jgi:hypothetical protein
VDLRREGGGSVNDLVDKTVIHFNQYLLHKVCNSLENFQIVLEFGCELVQNLTFNGFIF